MYNTSEITFLNCCQTIYFPQKVKRTFVKTKRSAQFFVILLFLFLKLSCSITAVYNLKKNKMAITWPKSPKIEK